MSMIESNLEHEAVTRLFDMVRNGETDNCEFDQLDSMIYERLVEAYGTGEAEVCRQTQGAL